MAKQVRIKINASLHERMQNVMAEYGFKSTQRLIRAMVTMLERRDTDIEECDCIANMFEELSRDVSNASAHWLRIKS